MSKAKRTDKDAPLTAPETDAPRLVFDAVVLPDEALDETPDGYGVALSPFGLEEREKPEEVCVLAAVRAKSGAVRTVRAARQAADELLAPWKLQDAKIRQAALIAGATESAEAAAAVERLNAASFPLCTLAPPDSSVRGGSLASRSMEARRGAWSAFVQWMKEKHPAAKTLGSLKPDFGKEYARELGKTLAAQSVRARLGAVRSVLAGFGMARGWDRTGDGIVRRAFTREEVAWLLSGATGEESGLLAALYWTGLRLGDAARLRRENRVTEGGRRFLVVLTAKGKKTVHLLESPELSAKLDAAQGDAETAGEEWLFPRAAAEASGKRRAALSRRLNAYVHKRLETFPGKAAAGGGAVSVHCFRHTLATLCADAGIPIETVWEWLGHGSAAVTEIYTHRDAAKTGAAIVDALSVARE